MSRPNERSVIWIRPDVSWSVGDDILRLFTRTDEYEIRDVSCASSLASFLPLLDGRRSLGEAVTRAGVSLESAIAVVGPMLEEAVMLDVDTLLTARDMEEFIRAFRRECHFHSQAILVHEFWETILSGRASRRLVLGWGIEFFHFVEAANEYMAAGVAFCREDADTREWVARHYVEEALHGRGFLDGLEKCGLDRIQIEQATPLPTTRGLLNYFYELATESSIAYTPIFGIMQADTIDDIKDPEARFFGMLSSHYPYAVPLFDAWEAHTRLDRDLRHDRTVFERICSRRNGLENSERRIVARTLRNTAEHFIAYFKGILEYYHDGPCQLPRRPWRLCATGEMEERNRGGS